MARLHRRSDDVRDRWFDLLDAMGRSLAHTAVLTLPGDPRWPYVLVRRDRAEAGVPKLQDDRLSHDALDQLARLRGLPPGSVVRATSAVGRGSTWHARNALTVADVAGFVGVEQHLAVVRPLVTAAGDP